MVAYIKHHDIENTEILKTYYYTFLWHLLQHQ
jgi:hypothetical protein